MKRRFPLANDDCSLQLNQSGVAALPLYISYTNI